MRPVTILLVLATMVLPQPGCDRAGRDPHPLESLFADLHGRGLFDGAVVVHDRRGVFSRGYGYADLERQVPFTPDTPADGASLAKTFTVALLLSLQGDGVLDLDDPARRFLPELPYPQVTLRHLITHSSAIPVLDYDFFDADIPADQDRTTDALLRVLAARAPALAAPPGTTFEYNNLAFDLAALAAARAAGSSYAALVRERFFEPLDLRSAFVRPARLRDFPGVRTLAYRRADDTLERHDVFDREGFHGGSNIYLSARDLDRWNASFLHAPVLRPAELALALQPAAIGHGTSGLSLGSWYHSGDGHAFWYSGHLQGFHSEAFRDLAAGHSIVYISNNTLEPWLQKALVRAVREVLAGRSVPPLAAPPTDRLSEAEHASLAGRWTLPQGDNLVIESAGAGLHVVRHGVRYRMFPASAAAFYVPGLDFMLGFARGAGGAVTRIHLSSNVEEHWGARTLPGRP